VSDTIASAVFPALGTTASVSVTEATAIDRARVVLAEELDRIDRACSRFRSDSELTRVNRSAGQPVRVGALLLQAVQAALRAAALTSGDVDPTVGRALRAIGYDADFESIRTGRAGVDRVVAAAGWRTVTVDAAASTVRVPRGVELDLGSTAKALAADRAAEAVFAATGAGALVNLGGDIAVAGPAPPDGWSVRVTDDHAAGVDAPGQTVAIPSGGLATSSVTVRRWESEGRAVHHIVDPRTGAPAAVVWRTVSVTAASCVDANTASTGAIVRGEGSPEWLESHGLPSRLVRPDGAVVYVRGWPEAAG
jgi:thiamine biosynthesis lipoprotein